MALRRFLGVLFFSCLCITCSREKADSNVLHVFVSILPQKYIIDRIGGTRVKAMVMVEPGASPHTYEPRPSQMAALSTTAVYFSIGLEFEKAWLSKFERLAPRMRVIAMDSGIAKLPGSGDAHEMGVATGVNEHNEHMDPHIWLSPELVKQQAKTVCEALRALDPHYDSLYLSHYNAFISQIIRLQDTIRMLLQYDPKTSLKSFMVFHPSWAYFAQEFNLRQIAIEVDGKEPGPRQLETIFDLAKRNSIRTIFVQPQFSQKSAQVIARQVQARTAVADDLAYDWETNLIAFARVLSQK
jgi:zinc transport system substrate-binding protein